MQIFCTKENICGIFKTMEIIPKSECKEKWNFPRQKNIQMWSKAVELLYKPKTKHAPKKIHNNMIKTTKHGIQTICNRTQTNEYTTKYAEKTTKKKSL